MHLTNKKIILSLLLSSFVVTTAHAGKCKDLLLDALFPLPRMVYHSTKPSSVKKVAKTVLTYSVFYWGMSYTAGEFILTTTPDFIKIGKQYELIKPKKILYIDALPGSPKLSKNVIDINQRHAENAEIYKIEVSSLPDLLAKLKKLDASTTTAFDSIVISAHGITNGIFLGSGEAPYTDIQIKDALKGMQFNNLSHSQSTVWFWSCWLASQNKNYKSENEIIPTISTALLPKGGVAIGSERAILSESGYLNDVLFRAGFANAINASGLPMLAASNYFSTGQLIPAKVVVWQIDQSGNQTKLP